MRILFLTSNPFFPEYFSGQNKTLLELCQKLTTLGHEPIILAGLSSSTEKKKIVTDNGYGFRLFRARNPVKSIPGLCASLHPDTAVIVDGDFETLLLGCSTVDIPVALWFFHVESYYYRNASPDKDLLYLASSPFLATRLNSLFSIEAQVVAPYIEQEVYRKKRCGRRVLFVNPVREKGVEIVYQLARQRPQQAFIFVESRSISKRWRRICFAQALSCSNIEWFTKTSDMDSILDQTRLLLLPCFSEEGFSRLVTEAQLGGIPALSSNRGYLPENVGQGGTTLSIDAGIKVWLKQLDSYLEDEAFYQQVSERAQLHASREELDGKQIIDRLLLLLSSHIAQQPTN